MFGSAGFANNAQVNVTGLIGRSLVHSFSGCFEFALDFLMLQSL
jgi:hypothetical protein